MNFHFDQDEQDVLDMLHDFCLKEVAPIAAEIDETERFPEETWHKLADMGMMGIAYPEEVGGAGMSYVTYIGACEELAKHCATTSVMVSAHSSLCCWPISEYGTEAQKEKYLSKLCSGEWLGAFGLTEPGAGTDAAMQKTVAEDKGDHWVLNGSKIFITNAGFANVFVVFAMTDKSLGTKGISAFIVERDFPGFKVGSHEKKMGIRGSSTCELVFEDCIVPKENLLGEIGKGFKIAMTTLDGGRIGIGAQALGIAQAAIDECVKYTKERVQFGKRISQFQNTQFQLADMQAKLDGARLLIYRAAQAKQDHEPYSHLAAMGKLMASEVASDVTRRALQLVGGYGYTREYPFERFMRDAKITEIYEGTSEVQRMVISGWMGVK
ncbi:acyl-CoA dehydrogenase [Intestinimonas butyriciproducens]|uniref:Butyryl-CoA dehydrogenase n=1 Tax=Intestinimonas butyriciproducens TaxID=1297617 RepID=A0A2U1BG82_9FIRM|nr:acyl-CoA dehydrogenase [Intestinimonas butyriciproducens]SCJ22698.1 Acyl-CoA dehydrogenase%2C short-chain specific [uncultured Clostridium sp.]MBU5230822.1 acyl-CoA dehydrogenase [Intestinimonas butyriciproducens]MCI6362530.1 acyl-CoA dehydrogenase [Intestinimonas butyriciproducens]MCR1906307.1 acyl-CoA dehydrogenase [Intestinimonas butyriciproducens]MDB7831463.1 acyl-CoA dehydrogenase [Intestinimonas butyriciproducens]